MRCGIERLHELKLTKSKRTDVLGFSPGDATFSLDEQRIKHRIKHLPHCRML
jgi:hypothetical protein